MTVNELFVSNLKFLRKQNKLTQDDLAGLLSVNRSAIGSYEEGRAVPRLSVISDLARIFKCTVDMLLHVDLAQQPEKLSELAEPKGLKILTTVVTPQNTELITVVPAKAAAGYLNGYADTEFIESLPQFALPLPELSRERTYRVFQIQGDSMLPVPSGAYIIGEYLPDLQWLKEGATYILLTRLEGMVYKRIYRTDNDQLLLKSDNPAYQPYTVHSGEVNEIWKAIGYINFNLPSANDANLNQLTQMYLDLRNELAELKRQQGDS